MSRSNNIKYFITCSLIFLGQLLFSQSLQDVINGSHRSQKNSARDKYRHPIETLEFFGIKNNMTVVEISPGGGWYQEILAPFLNKNGQYISATYDPKSEVKRDRDRYKSEKKRLAARKDLYQLSKNNIEKAQKRYKSIGESDRYTLKFMKPIN